MEEIGTLVEPGQRVFLPIICGKQELVAVASYRGDLVTMHRPKPNTVHNELVRL
jgi:hypothetical protein